MSTLSTMHLFILTFQVMLKQMTGIVEYMYVQTFNFINKIKQDSSDSIFFFFAEARFSLFVCVCSALSCIIIFPSLSELYKYYITSFSV